MIGQDLLSLLKNGVPQWNSWRELNKESYFPLNNADLRGLSLKGINFQNVDLSNAKLSNTDFSDADFRGAYLIRADLNQANFSNTNFSGARLDNATLESAILSGSNFFKASLNAAVLDKATLLGTNFQNTVCDWADFSEADLTSANFSKAILCSANFYETNLTDANLSEAILLDANLTKANLTRANLTKARLFQTRLIETNLSDAKLQGCCVYGVAVWNVNLKGAIQQDLIITGNKKDPIITVDNIEVAQFIFLILNNEKIRDVIDTITSKMVLILGRFTDERKEILDAIREQLRGYNFLPVLFDFKEPDNRDITETVSTLAHMARFVIADITEPAMIREELLIIAKSLPSVPIQPILLSSEKPYSSFTHLLKYPGMLALYQYDNLACLQGSLKEKVIEPPELYLKKNRPN